jgi:hypothetical protein
MGGTVGYKEAGREVKLARKWVIDKYIEKLLHLQTLNKRERGCT